MAFVWRNSRGNGEGILARLRHDKAGNVFAMTAAAVFPMIGVVGGAIDASRMYMVRTRLQAACDSAVLAGRKAMVTNVYDTVAQNRFNAMFNFNFQDSDYQTTGTAKNATADAHGKLSATASTSIPMTLMRVFGFGNQNASVTCSADIQIPNIDIVFVLDVTGSMADEINGTPKINSLKVAAKQFYTTLKTQMDANGANAGQVRYGFVPYSQTTNGKDLFKASPNAALGELPLSALVDNAVIESRVANFEAVAGNNEWIDDPATGPTTFEQKYDHSDDDTINPYVEDTNGSTVMSNNDCSNYGDNKSFSIDDNTNRRVYLYPLTSWPGNAGVGSSILYVPAGSVVAQTTEPTSGSYYYRITFDRVSDTWEDNNGAKTNKYAACVRSVTWTKFVRNVPQWKFKNWTYRPVTYNVSAVKSGGTITMARPRYWDGSRWRDNDNRDFDNYEAPSAGPYSPVELAATADAADLYTESFTWNGCIEERDTTAATTFTPIPTAAFDLNAKDGYTASDAWRWRPLLDKLTYNRGQQANATTTQTLSSATTGCPTARMRNLNTMTQTQFNAYIDSLQPSGYTYLDIGLVWGLRFIHPQGMFASRNLTGPNGGLISRHIIFLTDGEPVSADNSISSYGLEAVSKRITGNGTLTAATLHSRRFQALCDSQRGSIAIWAIALGTSVTGNLQTCADPGRAYQADDATELNNAFASIARDIADLRLVS